MKDDESWKASVIEEFIRLRREKDELAEILRQKISVDFAQTYLENNLSARPNDSLDNCQSSRQVELMRAKLIETEDARNYLRTILNQHESLI